MSGGPFAQPSSHLTRVTARVAETCQSTAWTVSTAVLPTRSRALAPSAWRCHVSPPSLDAARFFVDEDLSGLGIALMRLRRDVIVGRRAPAIEVAPKDDPDWIPIVAARGWVVITNDRHIRTGPVEADLANNAGLLCVCLRPTVKNATPWDFVMVLARHWPRVDELVGRKGPAWLDLRGSRARELQYQPGQSPRLP